MLRVKADRWVWWPVHVRVPEDGGTVSVVECQVQLRLATRTELERLRRGELDDAEAVAFLAERILDWRDIQDESGAAVTCSAETRAALLELPYFAGALTSALFAASAGAAAAGNSASGSAG